MQVQKATIIYIIYVRMKDVLLFGECLQLITAIPDESVDMVLCDLPYGVLNKGNLGAKWDCVIPFEPLWTQYKRICKEHAAIILFGSGMFTAKLMMSQPKLWRYNLVWDKVTTTGFLNCNRMPLRQHEDILVFYKKLPVFHPQMREGEWHTRQHGNDKNNCYGDFVMKPRVHSNMFYPTSILRFSKADSIRNGYHPTEKPVELCRYLIRQYSETGGGGIRQYDG